MSRIKIIMNNQINRHLALAILSSIIVFASGCSKHLSPGSTHIAQSRTSPSIPGKSIEDSLTGVWKMNKVEMQNMVDKITAYGSQADKNKLEMKLGQYQEAFKDLTVTFRKDSTYTSTYNVQSDTGHWQVDRNRAIQTTSTITGESLTYQIMSLEGSSIKVNVRMGDDELSIAFLKQ